MYPVDVPQLVLSPLPYLCPPYSPLLSQSLKIPLPIPLNSFKTFITIPFIIPPNLS